jgi:hypothetical protein
MKKILSLLLVIVIIFMGCSNESTTEEKMPEKTAKQLAEEKLLEEFAIYLGEDKEFTKFFLENYADYEKGFVATEFTQEEQFRFLTELKENYKLPESEAKEKAAKSVVGMQYLDTLVTQFDIYNQADPNRYTARKDADKLLKQFEADSGGILSSGDLKQTLQSRGLSANDQQKFSDYLVKVVGENSGQGTFSFKKFFDDSNDNFDSLKTLSSDANDLTERTNILLKQLVDGKEEKDNKSETDPNPNDSVKPEDYKKAIESIMFLSEEQKDINYNEEYLRYDMLEKLTINTSIYESGSIKEGYKVLNEVGDTYRIGFGQWALDKDENKVEKILEDTWAKLTDDEKKKISEDTDFVANLNDGDKVDANYNKAYFDKYKEDIQEILNTNPSQLIQQDALKVDMEKYMNTAYDLGKDWEKSDETEKKLGFLASSIQWFGEDAVRGALGNNNPGSSDIKMDSLQRTMRESLLESKGNTDYAKERFEDMVKVYGKGFSLLENPPPLATAPKSMSSQYTSKQ